MRSMQKFSIQTIAHIRSDFSEKFGIPRQSGILKNLQSQIIFEPEFRNADALRGLSDFSHLWLVWIFSENIHEGNFHPTVRPPRLGGNTRMGVFATRSSFRPNPIALSAVKIEKIEMTAEGPVITVSGADLMDGTPIVDIKPYLPFADSIPNASGGFTDKLTFEFLHVQIPEEELQKIPEEKRAILEKILAEDPRPAYVNDSERLFGFSFAGFEIQFTVNEKKLFVQKIHKI